MSPLSCAIVHQMNNKILKIYVDILLGTCYAANSGLTGKSQRKVAGRCVNIPDRGPKLIRSLEHGNTNKPNQHKQVESFNYRSPGVLQVPEPTRSRSRQVGLGQVWQQAKCRHQASPERLWLSLVKTPGTMEPQLRTTDKASTQLQALGQISNHKFRWGLRKRRTGGA